ncbi:MAG: hypothetical protein K2R93_21615 [Gemmatimonadaceae bacterium]|nr:hypothetical protein [Gemmatimonadaceae bacterium]
MIRNRSRRVALLLSLVVAGASATPALSPVAAQAAPIVETVVPFDSAGRLLVLTPSLVSRFGLVPPTWPVTGAYQEARLFLSSRDGYVLVARLADGAIYRYALSDSDFAALRRAVEVAVVAQGKLGTRPVGVSSSLEVSQPAGNAFVRNQTLLGVIAYGPATAALLSKSSGAAAAGGYFLAAGTSFFVAANTVRHRTVTRAQAARAAHGGVRGAITGLGIANMYNANGGPEWGAPILAGALIGTAAGFQQARGLTDGEAASAGLFADLGALTTLGVGGSLNAFRRRQELRTYTTVTPGGTFTNSYTTTDTRIRGTGQVTIGAAIGAEVLGYALGPRYARRAAYNVTAGDVTAVFTSALLGGLTTSGFVGESAKPPARFALGTAGMLLGAWAADRGMVRTADRTAADGTLLQLGALAGALMGGGVAALAEAEGQGAALMGGLGGALGLLAADNIIKPVKDAGPLRGIMQSASRRLEDRVQLSIGPVTSVRIAF